MIDNDRQVIDNEALYKMHRLRVFFKLWFQCPLPRLLPRNVGYLGTNLGILECELLTDWYA